MQSRGSKDFRTKLGNRLHGKLMRLADGFDMALTDYVRYVLMNHVRDAEIPKAEEPERPFIPFGA